MDGDEVNDHNCENRLDKDGVADDGSVLQFPRAKLDGDLIFKRLEVDPF